MKRNTWIFIGVAAVLAAAGGVYFFIKKKKEATMAGLSSDIELESEQTAALSDQGLGESGSAAEKISKLGDLTSGTQMTQIPSQPATAASAAIAADKPAAVVASKTSAPADTSLPAGTGKVLRAVKDESKGKAILRVSPKGLFKTGDTAKVKGSVYNGSFRVWYVFKSHATEDGVYIDTPYKGDDVGTISK
jgi:hypothetical protein